MIRTRSFKSSIRSRALTLLEVMISCAFLAIIFLGISTTLRSVGVQSAQASAESRIEQSLVNVLSTITDEVRQASRLSLTNNGVSDPIGSFGGKTISFQKVVFLDSTTGNPALSDVITYTVENGFFIRREGNLETRIGGYAPADSSPTGPGLSFSIVNDEVFFTVRVITRDAKLGYTLTRERSGRVVPINP